jgi:hypothetical protein
MEIHCDLFGVRFVPRGPAGDRHVCLQLLCEDDGFWHEHGDAFSSHHIDDLIAVLQLARAKLEAMPKDPDGFGWRFEKP